MAIGMFSGPELEKIKTELIEWYLLTKRELIELMEESQPYGSIKLDPQDQLRRAISMTPEEWQLELGRIKLRHRGEPDAEERVAKDVQDFLTHIKGIAQRYPSVLEGR